MSTEFLLKLGFLEAEVTVYTALLRLGSSPVSKIHKETGLHRTHIYDLLEKLREKGLVSTYIESGKKHFKPAPARRILAYLEDQKEIAETLLPELEELENLPRDETVVELFKGKSGIKTVLQDILHTGKSYDVMGAVKQFETILQYAMPQFLRQVAKKGIRERVLSDKDERILTIPEGSYRHLDGKYLFPSSFCIYGSKVAIFLWNPPYFAIVIENEHLKQTYRNYFEFFWEMAGTKA